MTLFYSTWTRLEEIKMERCDMPDDVLSWLQSIVPALRIALPRLQECVVLEQEDE